MLKNMMRQWGRAAHSKRKRQRAAISLASLALAMFGAPLLFGACGSDGSVAGNAGHTAQVAGEGSVAGNAGRAGEGTSGYADSGGQATAGVSSNGGSATGGASSKAGSGGLNSGKAGGGPRCENIECFRANVCLDRCGGKVVYTGCCQCGDGTVDELSCAATGGHASGGAGAS